VAYASDESGSLEVYLQSFPEPGSKLPVSVYGGGEPVWRSDGRELYYLAADRSLMAVDVAPEADQLHVSRPRVLFKAPVSGGLADYPGHYAVSADGERFLIDVVDSENTQESIAVIANWTRLVSE